jgi:hypothetical protein
MGRPAGAIRLGEYKLVEDYESGTLELYNLEVDISEAHDISGAREETTAKLPQMLVDWRQRVNAKMPKPNPDHH